MAQWAGQFSGNTHATKVKDLEEALRSAITALSTTRSIADRQQKTTAVRNLAKRLLSARLHLLKSRIVAARSKSSKQNTETLQKRSASVRESGVAGILAEFGAQDAMR